MIRGGKGLTGIVGAGLFWKSLRAGQQVVATDTSPQSCVAFICGFRSARPIDLTDNAINDEPNTNFEAFMAFLGASRDRRRAARVVEL